MQLKTYLSQKFAGRKEFIIPIARKKIIMDIVPTAAESWFSVSAETKRPIAIKVIPTRSIAIKLPRRTAVFTSAYL